MGSSNVKALKILKATIQELFFYHEDHRIYTISDSPHLFTSLIRKHNVSLPITVGDRMEFKEVQLDLKKNSCFVALLMIDIVRKRHIPNVPRLEQSWSARVSRPIKAGERQVANTGT
jgi:hypothetical protein